jgi:hypothetical protein
LQGFTHGLLNFFFTTKNTKNTKKEFFKANLSDLCELCAFVVLYLFARQVVGSAEGFGQAIAAAGF